MAKNQVGFLMSEKSDDIFVCQSCRQAKNIDESNPSFIGDYICNSCLNDLYDYSAE